MPRLDTYLIMHHLSISPNVKHVKKKLGKMHPHVALLVKEEFEKLLSVNFITTVDYAEYMGHLLLECHALLAQEC